MLQILLSILGITLSTTGLILAIFTARKSNEISLYQSRKGAYIKFADFLDKYSIIVHTEKFLKADTAPDFIEVYNTTKNPIVTFLVNAMPKTNNATMANPIFGIIEKYNEYKLNFIIEKTLFNEEIYVHIEILYNVFNAFFTKFLECFEKETDEGIRREIQIFSSEVEIWKTKILHQMAELTAESIKKYNLLNK